MSRMIIFDDRAWPGCGPDAVDLTPMTDLRACFEVRTGMLTTRERLVGQWEPGLAAVWAPDELEAVTAVETGVAVNVLPPDDSFFCVNGRWVFPAVRFELRLGQALVERESGHVVAAELTRADAASLFETGKLPQSVERLEHDSRFLLRRPWEVIAALPRVLHTDLLGSPIRPVEEPPDRVIRIGDGPLLIEPTARIMPGAILDVEHGPIVLDAFALVRPGATIIGPAYIGEHSQVLDLAIIKANTSIGPWCKVSGEIGATIFQGYSNKAHDGHLGDSWLGQWVNLGAGTTNSNLLNTYGEVVVRQRVGGSNRRSGMQFLGSIIGDHAKTAIGTRLMTGSVIGTGAMLASTAPPPACVAPFTWLTDDAERSYRIDKFIEVARTVMARRQIELTGAMELRLRSLYQEATAT